MRAADHVCTNRLCVPITPHGIGDLFGKEPKGTRNLGDAGDAVDLRQCNEPGRGVSLLSFFRFCAIGQEMGEMGDIT